MEWSAQITEKSEVTSDGTMTYSFTVLADGQPVNGVLAVSGTPSEIQQLLEDRIRSFAEAYETADSLPDVGEILPIIINE